MNIINFVEIWKPIILPNVKPDLYMVSTFGRVMNNKGLILKPIKINTGYYIYRLYSGVKGEYSQYLIHRLVMLTFYPINNPDLYTVDHINGDKTINALYNLEWVTQLENNIRSHNLNQNYNFGVTHYKSKLNEYDVKLICLLLEKGYSYKEIIIKLGKDPLFDTNYYDLIGNIKRGITYKNISCDYNF